MNPVTVRNGQQLGDILEIQKVQDYGVLESNVFVYLDVIVFVSNSFDEHVRTDFGCTELSCYSALQSYNSNSSCFHNKR